MGKSRPSWRKRLKIVRTPTTPREYIDYITGLRRVYRYGLGGNVESVTAYTLDGASILAEQRGSLTISYY